MAFCEQLFIAFCVAAGKDVSWPFALQLVKTNFVGKVLGLSAWIKCLRRRRRRERREEEEEGGRRKDEVTV
jgi:hypothetical protein